MKTAHLRFSPDILKRLGEELNPFLDKGILELAKNAYDADAIHCTITLEHIEHPGGQVTVTDDGKGMSVDNVLSGWLVLGHSGKSTKKQTKLGRVPSGSKGLGRLAALRLGKQAQMTTQPKGEGWSTTSVVNLLARFRRGARGRRCAADCDNAPESFLYRVWNYDPAQGTQFAHDAW